MQDESQQREKKKETLGRKKDMEWDLDQNCKWGCNF